MSVEIEYLGHLSSTNPHPQSLIKPQPFTTAFGETKDPILHIAVAQVLPDQSGLHSNNNGGDHGRSAGLEKLERWASGAASRGADVVVFPEYFLSGATRELWRKVREAQRERANDGRVCEEGRGEKAWIQVIISVAQKFDIDIVAGTVVELGTQPHADLLSNHPVGGGAGDKIPHRPPQKAKPDQNKETQDALFNTSYYISRQGKVLHRYTKQNLWHPERETLLHSQQHTHPAQHHGPSTFLIQTKRGTKLRAAMAICWDLAWYSRFHQMLTPPYEEGRPSDLDKEGQVKGPDVIFAPTCWYASDGGAKALLWNGTGEVQMLDTLCLARAVELEALLVMCNVAGPYMTEEKVRQLRQELTKQIQKGEREREMETPLIGLGRSRICAPFLNVVAQVEDQREVMLLQSVDLNLLRHAREMYRMRYDHAQK
ncbi:uncharacterized protein UDID_05337 [Ustilago sp. UG-2017a]|nr:uncharacterized protein UDID_05337 [Ustilago sp. UG-2017a]